MTCTENSTDHSFTVMLALKIVGCRVVGCRMQMRFLQRNDESDRDTTRAFANLYL